MSTATIYAPTRRRIRLVLGFVLCVAFGTVPPHADAAGRQFRVVNDTSRPIYFAFATEHSGGHDGISGTGSWSFLKISGWYRVGAYQDRAFNVPAFAPLYLHVVDHRGVVRTRTRKVESCRVVSAYRHPSKRFSFTQFTHDNTGKRRVSSSQRQSVVNGGRLAVFEEMTRNGKRLTRYRIRR